MITPPSPWKYIYPCIHYRWSAEHERFSSTTSDQFEMVSKCTILINVLSQNIQLNFLDSTHKSTGLELTITSGCMYLQLGPGQTKSKAFDVPFQNKNCCVTVFNFMFCLFRNQFCLSYQPKIEYRHLGHWPDHWGRGLIWDTKIVYRLLRIVTPDTM